MCSLDPSIIPVMFLSFRCGQNMGVHDSVLNLYSVSPWGCQMKAESLWDITAHPQLADSKKREEGD